MKELIRSNDLVLISWLQATLADAGIETIVFDQYASAVEGSVGPIPRRVMVHEDDFSRARWIFETQKPENVLR
jgi:hypothetical protein